MDKAIHFFLKKKKSAGIPITISEKENLTGLAFVGLCSNIKQKLEHLGFLSVNQLLKKIFSCRMPK
jgi:hypothetical protein